MKIESGGSYGEATQVLNTNTVRFMAPDGRAMFEVVVGKDGISIEVRSIAVTNVEGVLYNNRFCVVPEAANVVTIRAMPFDG